MSLNNFIIRWSPPPKVNARPMVYGLLLHLFAGLAICLMVYGLTHNNALLAAIGGLTSGMGFGYGQWLFSLPRTSHVSRTPQNTRPP